MAVPTAPDALAVTVSPSGLFDGLTSLPGHPSAHLGDGCAALLGDVLDRLGATRLLLVHGQGSFFQCGAGRLAEKWGRHREVHHFDAFTANPRVEDVEAGVHRARVFRPQAVVGIGGGSALDMAKMIAVLSEQDATPGDCLAHPELVRAPRACSLILLPTTAGSGSEMTRFATVYAGGRKHSLDHSDVRADVVLVDPLLAASVPQPAAVAAALDALSQAVESYWSVSATSQSKQLARSALVELLPALGGIAAYGGPGTGRGGAGRDGSGHGGAGLGGAGAGWLASPDVRTRLARGASAAGAAIDITRTTAAHALSYALTARLGLPHGAAVAVHLRWLIGHHAQATTGDCRHPGGPSELRRIIDDVQDLSVEATSLTIEQLLARLLAAGGHPVSIHDLALPAEHWAVSLTEALSSRRAENTPRTVTAADVHRLLS